MDIDVDSIRADKRKQINDYLTDAERLFHDADPYVRQNAYDSAALAYSLLGPLYDDVTIRKALNLASLNYHKQAALIRWRHQIPTLRPHTEVSLLGLDQCDECGRPWQVDTAGACEICPRPLYGCSPTSAEDAERLPAGVPATLSSSSDDF